MSWNTHNLVVWNNAEVESSGIWSKKNLNNWLVNLEKHVHRSVNGILENVSIGLAEKNQSIQFSEFKKSFPQFFEKSLNILDTLQEEAFYFQDKVRNYTKSNQIFDLLHGENAIYYVLNAIGYWELFKSHKKEVLSLFIDHYLLLVSNGNDIDDCKYNLMDSALFGGSTLIDIWYVDSVLSSDYIHILQILSKSYRKDIYLLLAEDFYFELIKTPEFSVDMLLLLLKNNLWSIDNTLSAYNLIELLLWFANGYVRWERIEDDGEWKHGMNSVLAQIFSEALNGLFWYSRHLAIVWFRKNLILDPDLNKNYKEYLHTRSWEVRELATTWKLSYTNSQMDLNDEIYSGIYLTHISQLLVAKDLLSSFWEVNEHVMKYSKIEDDKLDDGVLLSEILSSDHFSSHLSEKTISLLISLLHHPGIMMQIEESIGIEFRDYPFSIQPHFLKFLAYATTDDMARVKTYLAHAKNSEEKLTRLRVFLATAEGRSFGDIILDIDVKLVEKFGENEGTNIGNELFSKYARIMKVAEEDAEAIKWEFYGADSDAQFSKQRYIQELLKWANKILGLFHETLNDTRESRDWNEVFTKNILQMLDECSVDMIQYGTLFKVTNKDSTETLENVMKNLGIKPEEVSGDKMTKEQKRAIDSLYEVNYRNNPKREEILKFVWEGLKEDYHNPRTKFHLFSYRDECLLSVKFIEQDDGSIYAGAFNARLQFQKYSFGNFAIGKLLEHYSDRDVRGHVIVGSDHLLDFYGKHGFIQERDNEWNPIIEIKEGVKLYKIVRPKQKENKIIAQSDHKIQLAA